MITLEIAQQYFQEKILDIEEVFGNGQVNKIYIIYTFSSKVILRIDPNNNTIDRFEKEEWCMSEAKKHWIPTPEVFAVWIKNHRPYMILSYIEGIDWNKTNKTAQSRIWKKLWEYAHIINNIKVNWFGEKMISKGIFNGNRNVFVDYNVSSLDKNDKLLELNIITVEEQKKLCDLFLRLKNKKYNFWLAHHDLSLKNTRVDKDEVVYLLDWWSAQVNIIPQIEIIEILWSSLSEESDDFKSFLKHYWVKNYLTIKEDIMNIKTLICIDKLRRAIEKKPGLIKQKTKEFKDIFSFIKKQP